jgi:prolyl 4-hydroxylase
MESTINFTNSILKEISRFISDEESNKLIELAEVDLQKMTVLGENSPNDYRIAQGTWLPNDLEPMKNIRDRISKIINIPVENMEASHIVKYDVGGEYKTHHDFFHLNTDYLESELQRGGQRTHTALIYLNDNFEGGETEFPKLNQIIKPQKNKLVIWKNLKDNGDLNMDSLHAGLPVKLGSKYILVIWIREKKFV